MLLQVGMERYVWPLPARKCGVSWNFMCQAREVSAGLSRVNGQGKLHSPCFSWANRLYSV